MDYSFSFDKLVNSDNIYGFCPPKTPIVLGYIYKISGLLLKPLKKYFALDPNIATFI